MSSTFYKDSDVSKTDRMDVSTDDSYKVVSLPVTLNVSTDISLDVSMGVSKMSLKCHKKC